MKIINLFCLLLLMSSCSNHEDIGKVESEKEVRIYKCVKYIMVNDSLLEENVDYSAQVIIDSNNLTWTKYNLNKNQPLVLNGLIIQDSLVIKGQLDKCSRYSYILNWKELSSFSETNTLTEYMMFWGKSDKIDSSALAILLLQDIGAYNLGLGYIKDSTEFCWSIDSIKKSNNLCTLTLTSHTDAKNIVGHHLDIWNHFVQYDSNEFNIATITVKIVIDIQKKVVLSTENSISVKDLESNIYLKVQKMQLN